MSEASVRSPWRLRAAALPLHTLLKFAAVGVLNTSLTFFIIVLLKSVFGAADVIANFCAYTCGLMLSFVLNKRWTFDDRAAFVPAIARFLAVFCVAYAINLGVLLTLIHLGVNDYLAHLIGMPFYTVAFYLGCRHFAFATGANARQAKQTTASESSGWIWFLAMLPPLLLVLLYRLGAAPVAIWDESRLGINAVEMAQSGLSLITTYGGLPDHWNTKPPLAIWLMSLSIRALGINEWALRLPSVLAALATAGLMYGFCARHLKRPFAGFTAVLLLLATPGYVVAHGARSGDYDSMLTWWTTAYLLAAYVYIHAQPERRTRWLVALCACIVLAFLTKTIQALIFLPAVLAVATVQRRMPGILRSRGVYAGVAVMLVSCVGYYLLREHADPGYMVAVRANDLGGRYGTVLENHEGGLLWYATDFRRFPWLLPGLLSALLIAWRGSAEQRKIAVHLGAAALFYLLIISTASTKLWWYQIPLAPLAALLSGMAIDIAVQALHARKPDSKTVIARSVAVCSIGAALLVVGTNLIALERQARWMAVNAFDRYDVFLRSAVPAEPKRNLVVVHPGYPNGQRDAFYVAPALYYVAALRAQGHTVTIQPLSDTLRSDATSLIVCGDDLSAKTKAMVSLQLITADSSGCGWYQIERSGTAPVH